MRHFLLCALLVVFLGCTSHDINATVAVEVPAIQENHTAAPSQETSVAEQPNPLPQETKLCEKMQLTNTGNRKWDIDIGGNTVIYTEDGYMNKNLFSLDYEINQTRALGLVIDADIFNKEIAYSEGAHIISLNIEDNKTYYAPTQWDALDVATFDDILMFSKQINFFDVYYLNKTEKFEQCPHLVYEYPYANNDKLAIYDNIFVWRSVYPDDDYSKILMYNLSNRGNETQYDFMMGWSQHACYYKSSLQPREIAVGKVDNPTVYKDVIVWQQNDSNNWDILMYNLTSNESKILAYGSHDEMNPAVSSRYVVWQDYSNNNWDLYAYDLLKDKEIQLTEDSEDQTNPEIFENHLVWMENNEIYSCWLSST